MNFWAIAFQYHILQNKTLVLKFWRDTAMQIIPVPGKVKTVIFETQDPNFPERLNKQKTIIQRNKHYLKGSSNPVHLCLEGVQSNVGIYEKNEADLNDAGIVRHAIEMYEAGVSHGSLMFDKETKENKMMFFLMIGVILLGLANLALAWFK